jgi:putative ABC transport system ATP-binding protein
MGPLLEVKGLACTFERWGQTVRALDDVNLSIPSGQCLVIAGHNGAGKSTLLRIVAGRNRDYTGNVWLERRLLRRVGDSDLARQVYYLHQDPALGSAPGLTVFENLVIADRYAGRLSRRSQETRYMDLLREVSLESRIHHPAHYLSGGERQLLAFLIARMWGAPIVLLDEPFAALDARRALICVGELDRFRSTGTTILLVTHSVTMAASFGDRTIVLSAGQVIYDVQRDQRSERQIRELIQRSEEAPLFPYRN